MWVTSLSLDATASSDELKFRQATLSTRARSCVLIPNISFSTTTPNNNDNELEHRVILT